MTSFQAPGITPFDDASGRQLAGLGQQVTRAGVVGMRLFEVIDAQANAARAKTASAELSDSYRELLQDAQNGYLNSQGENAGSRFDDTVRQLEERRRRIGDALDNPDQKAAFAELSERQHTRALELVHGHKANQTYKMAVDASQARITAAVRDAVSAETSADRQELLDDAFGELEEQAALQGLSADRLAEQKIAVTDEVFTQAIEDQLAAKNPGGARELFREAESKLKPESRRVLRQKVQQGELYGRALFLSTDMLQRARKVADEQRETLATNLRDAGRTEEADRLLDPDVDPVYDPGMLFVHAESLLRAKVWSEEITPETYAATVEQMARDVRLLTTQRAAEVNTEWNNMVQWLDADPQRSVEEFPGKGTLVQAGKWPEALSHARNNRTTTDPKALVESLSYSPAQYAQMTEAGFMLRYIGKLEDKHMNLGLARIRAARGAASAEDFSSLSIHDLQEEFARDFGVDPKEQPEEFTAILRRLDVIAGAARVKKGVSPQEYEEKVLKPARERRSQVGVSWAQSGAITDRQEITGRDVGLDRGLPIAVQTPEQAAEGTVIAQGEVVKLADISDETRVHLRRLGRERGLTEQELQDPQVIAELWIKEDKPYPASADPSLPPEQREFIMKSSADRLREVQKLPAAVREKIMRNLRLRWQSTGYNPGGMPNVELRPTGPVPSADQVWEMWQQMGRPLDADRIPSGKWMPGVSRLK